MKRIEAAKLAPGEVGRGLEDGETNYGAEWKIAWMLGDTIEKIRLEPLRCVL